MILNTMTQPQIKQKDAPENGSLAAATTQDGTNQNQSPQQIIINTDVTIDEIIENKHEKESPQPA